MTRFLLTLLTTTLISPLAFAADDGGFGSKRFADQAPAALSGTQDDDAMAARAVDPSQIEPAAGNEEADADANVEVEDAPSVSPEAKPVE